MAIEKDRSRPGSPERFVELLQPIKNGLLLYARSLSGDRDTAKDLVSEAIMISYTHFSELRNEQALKSYLYTTTKRLATQHRIHENRHEQLEAAWGHEDCNSSPEVLTDIHLLQEALGRLPEAQRDAIIWKDLSGLQLEEIRELQGGSLSAVKMRLVRGREELARLMGAASKKNNNTESSQVVTSSEPSVIPSTK